ncbi:MAG: iron-containing alcohol dehydrogenase [Candidatus Hydrogenedentota bacterium]
MDKLGWHSLGTTFYCECGHEHMLPIKACYQGLDASQKLADFAREHCGAQAFLISDENTYQVGGEEVERALTDAGKTVHCHQYGADIFEATEELGEEVRNFATESDFLVAVGSGTLCDLAKYAGDKLKKPVLLYGTAASMNGYTSAITALKVRGLKRTLPCTPALGVFCNPEHAATAPTRMTAAGVADFLSKCSSSTDWRAAHLLEGVYYCHRPREFFDGTQELILEHAPRVPEGDPESIQHVMEALLLSGCSMVIAGSSAPASGGEHLLSHYLDMKSALYDLPNDFHGSQVGVGTIYCLELWEKVLALNPEDIDVDALIERKLDDRLIRQAIDDDWGTIAPKIHEQWDAKKKNGDEMRKALRFFQTLLPQLKQQLPADLLPAQTVANAIQQSGGPIIPEDLTAPTQEYYNAQKRARYIRNRFTILDLAHDLGLTE